MKLIFNKKTGLALVLIALVAIAGACALLCCNKGGEYKVASVNVQAVVSKSSQVLSLKKEQQEKAKELQSWLATAKQEVEKQKDENSKQDLLEKYNADFVVKQQKLAEEYGKKLQAIDKSISAVVEAEAKKMGYSLVISKDIVLYGATDITDVIAKKVK